MNTSSYSLKFRLVVVLVAGLAALVLFVAPPTRRSCAPGYIEIDRPRQSGSQHVCSSHVLRKYFSEHHRFPLEGRWNENNTTFIPDLCFFNRTDLATCFSQKQVKHIVILGDSNGSRYFDGFMELFAAMAMRCKTVRGEHYKDNTPETEYFSRGDKYLEAMMVTHRRGCRTCGSTVMACTGRNGHQVLLEYIALYSLRDGSISLNASMTSQKGPQDHPFPHAKSFPEFLFRVYFKETCPDLLFIFTPFNHDIMSGNVTVVRQSLTDFLSLLSETCQSRSATYWLTAATESTKNKPDIWKNRLYEGMTSNEKLQLLNYVLYTTLESKLLDKSSNTFGFFNHFEITRPKPQLNYDGVHLLHSWYTFITSALTFTFCAS